MSFLANVSYRGGFLPNLHFTCAGRALQMLQRSGSAKGVRRETGSCIGLSHSMASFDRFSASSGSVTTISRINGCPSGIRERLLLGSLVKNDNSIRCMIVSIRRNAWPRNETSCVAKTKRSCCSFPSLVSSEKANWSNGSSRLRSADNSILTARAFGSLAQHSGDFVLMCLCGLRTMTTRKFETADSVRRAAAEA